VARLEGAAEARENRVRFQENELRDQLEQARTERAAAAAVNEDLSRRLEGAIARLEAAMES